jgi:hypothetical protein
MLWSQRVGSAFSMRVCATCHPRVHVTRGFSPWGWPLVYGVPKLRACHSPTWMAGEVVRVVGKGRKAREVPVKGGTLEAIRAWLRCRGGEPGPLSVPFGRAAGWSCGRSRLRQSCGSVRNEGRKRGCGSSRRTTCVAPKSACC